MSEVGDNSGSVNAPHLRAFIERVNFLLRYDPVTGCLFWKVRTSNRVSEGMRAGNISLGYREVSIDSQTYRATHIIWLICFGCRPKHFIDHINGIRDDDRLCNLREATPAQNARNVRMHFDNKCGYKGVIEHSRRGKPFQARIFADGKQKSLGYYRTPHEAHQAYEAASRDIHGEFGRCS